MGGGPGGIRVLSTNELRQFLDEKASLYNHPRFIESDPVQIPHLFSSKEDIEIAGFLTATISWGKRVSIIKSAFRLMDLMGSAPYDFVMSHNEDQLERLDDFVYRTFNSTDLRYFIRALRYIYREHGGLEGVFNHWQMADSLQTAIHQLKQLFFSISHPERTRKHLPDPLTGSAAKRVNMYLRWMVRSDNHGVDFGIWKQIPPSSLSCPLDVHTGNVARRLGLIHRKQNDAKAVIQLDEQLRILNPEDPVKYDFALFGLGIFEKF